MIPPPLEGDGQTKWIIQVGLNPSGPQTRDTGLRNTIFVGLLNATKFIPDCESVEQTN